ncbi:MAG: response regulator [Candidatus Omnitrophica bacterium]|nr:response regulator [Candidatus Omnitrophota bacterium]MBI5145522.1 response regulator [Candidatus Omnitrophota bacterium]
MAKILLADDDADIRDIISGILQKEGFEVVLAKDGNEALDLTKANRPELVLLDYLMPGLNGIEVCAALKKDKETKSIPIIMMTAYASEKEGSLSAGAIDFITKPIEKVDLLLRIRSVLKVKHINNELQKIIAYIEELGK